MFGLEGLNIVWGVGSDHAGAGIRRSHALRRLRLSADQDAVSNPVHARWRSRSRGTAAPDGSRVSRAGIGDVAMKIADFRKAKKSWLVECNISSALTPCYSVSASKFPAHRDESESKFDRVRRRLLDRKP